MKCRSDDNEIQKRTTSKVMSCMQTALFSGRCQHLEARSCDLAQLLLSSCMCAARKLLFLSEIL